MTKRVLPVLLVVCTVVVAGCSRSTAHVAGDVVFTGGHETVPVDRGRPVVLIAGALGVKPQVFRDAFSGVTPAQGGHPTSAEARANKDVLMRALSPHGITNERLDAVSDYYRYQPQSGRLWKNTPASATAIFEDGKVTGFKVIEPGAGYTTPPTIKVVGHEGVHAKAKLAFGLDFKTNGRVASIDLVPSVAE